METVSGWVWAANLKPLLTLLSGYLGYAFDETDWETIALGLAGTDDDESERWYGYPLVGRHTVTVWLAEAVGSEVVSVRIESLPDRELVLRAQTLLDAYAQYR